MSLYGALYAGVSGLKSQGSKIGVISDNIANVNTVGYKASQAQFRSLVTNTSLQASYSPGGVIATTRQMIDKQGLISSTDTPTDVAISGKGFFVVRSSLSSDAETLYTRAGSFRQDSLGNFINGSGFYLMGWPLDRDGLLPGEPGNVNTTSAANLDSLQLVNVSSSSGIASATTRVTIGANLDASQTIYPGAGATTSIDSNSVYNHGTAADSILIPGEFGITNPNSIVRGDIMTVTTGGGSTNDLVYGGFMISRNVSTGAVGDLNKTQDASASAMTFATANGSTTVTVTDAAHGYATGDKIYIGGVAGATVGGIPVTELQGYHTVTVTGANTYTFTVTTAATSTVAATAGTATNHPFTGNMMDSSLPGSSFLGVTGTSGFSTAALTFTITSSSGGLKTFTYKGSSPNTLNGEFNSLNSLATAINEATGLTARVVSNRLYVGSENANDGLTFANGDDQGTDGLNWVSELGLSDVTAAAAGVNRFSTQNSLAAAFNTGIEGLSAVVSDASSAASTRLYVDDPRDTITFSDKATNSGSILAELGLATSLNGGAFAAQTDGPLGPKYDAAADGTTGSQNMASGDITAQFSRNIRVYDSLGTGHDLRLSYLKVGTNTWAVEVHAIPPTDVTVGTRTDGQVAAGSITFNGDGSLRTVESGLTAPVNIDWADATSGASNSTITFEWGTAGDPFGTAGATVIGKTDGLSQFDSDYNVSFINQNGSAPGSLTRVSIDTQGYLIASYTNGQTQKIYKLPVADFSNPDGLRTITGNVFAETGDSGVVNLRQAGQGGAGDVISSSLESSNVELASELTDMIIAQRAYQANTRVIKTSDELLDQLSQL